MSLTAVREGGSGEVVRRKRSNLEKLRSYVERLAADAKYSKFTGQIHVVMHCKDGGIGNISVSKTEEVRM